jgi:hypothetical protein
MKNPKSPNLISDVAKIPLAVVSWSAPLQDWIVTACKDSDRAYTLFEKAREAQTRTILFDHGLVLTEYFPNRKAA